MEKELTDHEIAKQWYAALDMSFEISYRWADAQVQLGFGRVDPVRLSNQQWAECEKYVAYCESIDAY